MLNSGKGLDLKRKHPDHESAKDWRSGPTETKNDVDLEMHSLAEGSDSKILRGVKKRRYTPFEEGNTLAGWLRNNAGLGKMVHCLSESDIGGGTPPSTSTSRYTRTAPNLLPRSRPDISSPSSPHPIPGQTRSKSPTGAKPANNQSKISNYHDANSPPPPGIVKPDTKNDGIYISGSQSTSSVSSALQVPSYNYHYWDPSSSSIRSTCTSVSASASASSMTHSQVKPNSRTETNLETGTHNTDGHRGNGADAGLGATSVRLLPIDGAAPTNSVSMMTPQLVVSNVIREIRMPGQPAANSPITIMPVASKWSDHAPAAYPPKNAPAAQTPGPSLTAEASVQYGGPSDAINVGGVSIPSVGGHIGVAAQTLSVPVHPPTVLQLASRNESKTPEGPNLNRTVDIVVEVDTTAHARAPDTIERYPYANHTSEISGTRSDIEVSAYAFVPSGATLAMVIDGKESAWQTQPSTRASRVNPGNVDRDNEKDLHHNPWREVNEPAPAVGLSGLVPFADVDIGTALSLSDTHVRPKDEVLPCIEEDDVLDAIVNSRAMKKNADLLMEFLQREALNSATATRHNPRGGSEMGVQTEGLWSVEVGERAEEDEKRMTAVHDAFEAERRSWGVERQRLEEEDMVYEEWVGGKWAAAESEAPWKFERRGWKEAKARWDEDYILFQHLKAKIEDLRKLEVQREKKIEEQDDRIKAQEETIRNNTAKIKGQEEVMRDKENSIVDRQEKTRRLNVEVELLTARLRVMQDVVQQRKVWCDVMTDTARELEEKVGELRREKEICEAQMHKFPDSVKRLLDIQQQYDKQREEYREKVEKLETERKWGEREKVKLGEENSKLVEQVKKYRTEQKREGQRRRDFAHKKVVEAEKKWTAEVQERMQRWKEVSTTVIDK